MNCRHCGAALSLEMVDLGRLPVANAFRTSLAGPENTYPLKVLVCELCWLAQTDISEFTLGYDQIFTEDYPYYSSTSPSFVEQARRFVQIVTERFHLGPDSLTVEIGSNDGYLLQWVKTPCYGVEPTATGKQAIEKGIATVPEFFTSALAKQMIETSGQADLMIANNVLAHVPDINDFVRGFEILLKPSGVAVFEFPSLVNLVVSCQFDTIYHEHYSYLSLTSAKTILEAAGLRVFDVEQIPTHGGSLRVYACKDDRPTTTAVNHTLDDERLCGVTTRGFYFPDFQQGAWRIRAGLLSFLHHAKEGGRRVAGFGAAAKGNTLLNYCAVTDDLLAYVVDDTPAKQGKFLPGSRIQVLATFPDKPAYVLILPWNFRADIMAKLAYVRDWGARFVVAIPQLEII